MTTTNKRRRATVAATATPLSLALVTQKETVRLEVVADGLNTPWRWRSCRMAGCSSRSGR